MVKKKDPKAKLKTRCELLWKEVCKLRDGGVCQLCGGQEILQIDHCFSRTNSELFFDVRNGTTLCRSCHFKKTHNIKNASRRVDRIVIEREGMEWFKTAEEISERLSPYIWNVIELEQLEIKLLEIRAEYLEKSNE